MLVLPVSLAACGGSDSANGGNVGSDNASALVGTWESNEAPGTFYEFKADGTGTLKGEGYSMDFTYEDKGTAIDFTYEGSDAVHSDKYTISCITLTLAGITYTKK